jgi:hypothetical protein
MIKKYSINVQKQRADRTPKFYGQFSNILIFFFNLNEKH